MMGGGLVDALEYACINEFTVFAVSVSSYAAGVALALVSRNDEGKTLAVILISLLMGSQ